MIIEIINSYIELIARLLRASRIELGFPGVRITIKEPFKEQVRATIDERINKIDTARENLADVINAIDGLKKEAQQNKIEAAQALQPIAELEQDKESLSEELEAIRTVIRSDVVGFRKVAGITNKTRERFIGFISGIIASMIASGIIIGLIKLIQYIISNS